MSKAPPPTIEMTQQTTFKTKNPYTNAKVMVWGGLGNMTPICGTEIVK